MSDCKCRALCVCKAKELLAEIARKHRASGGYQPYESTAFDKILPPPKKR